jgi:hypothetical protein
VENNWGGGIEYDGLNSGPCKFAAIFIKDKANMHGFRARRLEWRQVNYKGLSWSCDLECQKNTRDR